MSADRFAATRRAMVSNQLRTNAVDDARLVEAMGRIPREAFVPAARQEVAYTDIAIPLGEGRALNPPMATARLLDAAAIGPGDRVLIVGAATGYALAVAAATAGKAVGVECDKALAAQAVAAVPSATLVTGPLELGAPDHAPFDAIVIDGAVEEVPPALIDQLAPAGRLATGIIDAGGVTRLALGRRGGSGFGLTAFADADVVALPGFARPRAFVF